MNQSFEMQPRTSTFSRSRLVASMASLSLALSGASASKSEARPKHNFNDTNYAICNTQVVPNGQVERCNFVADGSLVKTTSNSQRHYELVKGDLTKTVDRQVIRVREYNKDGDVIFRSKKSTRKASWGPTIAKAPEQTIGMPTGPDDVPLSEDPTYVDGPEPTYPDDTLVCVDMETYATAPCSEQELQSFLDCAEAGRIWKLPLPGEVSGRCQ